MRSAPRAVASATLTPRPDASGRHRRIGNRSAGLADRALPALRRRLADRAAGANLGWSVRSARDDVPVMPAETRATRP